MCFRKSFFSPKIFTNIWHEINLMRHNELFSCCSYVLWPHPVPSYIIFYHKSWRPQNCYNCVLCPHHFSTHSDKLVSHKTWNSRKSLQIRSLNYQVWQKKNLSGSWDVYCGWKEKTQLWHRNLFSWYWTIDTALFLRSHKQKEHYTAFYIFRSEMWKN